MQQTLVAWDEKLTVTYQGYQCGIKGKLLVSRQ